MMTIDKDYLKGTLLNRKDDSHKRDYGHALLVCGCSAMPGAAVLAVGGALKSGCGLVTLHSTDSAVNAAAVQFPSAMLSVDPGQCFSVLPGNLSKYNCIGMGPGLGTSEVTSAALEFLLSEVQVPLVLDADALNIISASPELWNLVPAGSVLTPHLGELGRFLPDWETDGVIQKFCNRTGCVLVKKGYHTQVFSPSWEVFENTTGNPGMAKGGSGDVLTGLITGLVARGYDSLTAALLGVWIHGYSGDCLTRACTAEAWNSRDLIDHLYEGFKALSCFSAQS